MSALHSFFQALQTFIQEYSVVYGYPVLFLVVMLENAGIPVPGETAVLFFGFLASPAGHAQFNTSHFDIIWVVGVAFLAAIIGDNLGFWLGHRWARPRLQQGRRFLFLTPKTLQLAEEYFQRYGLWTIFFARFITGLRVVGAVAAGTAGMPWLRFLLANAAGALAWSVTMSLLGYFFGHSWELLHKALGRGGLIILGCVIVLAVLPVLLRHLRRLPTGVFERLPRAYIWQALLVALLEVVCIGLLVLKAQGEKPTVVDSKIDAWIMEAARAAPRAGDVCAFSGALVGSLPVTTACTLFLLIGLWLRKRPWREKVATLWALVASEVIGLILLGLFRARDIEPVDTLRWPIGFAGLIPLRAFAVYGMSAKLAARQSVIGGRVAIGLAVLLILISGFSVLWMLQQEFTEVILEYAAGGLVVFAGVWWLEGHGPVFADRSTQEPTR